MADQPTHAPIDGKLVNLADLRSELVRKLTLGPPDEETSIEVTALARALEVDPDDLFDALLDEAT